MQVQMPINLLFIKLIKITFNQIQRDKTYKQGDIS